MAATHGHWKVVEIIDMATTISPHNSEQRTNGNINLKTRYFSSAEEDVGSPVHIYYEQRTLHHLNGGGHGASELLPIDGVCGNFNTYFGKLILRQSGLVLLGRTVTGLNMTVP